MKICFLAHNIREDNGAGVLARRVIEGLRGALPCDVAAYTSVPSGAAYERPLSGAGFFGAFGRLWQIRASIRQSDAVHAFDVFPYGFMAALAALGAGKPLVITAMGSGAVLPLYHPYQAPLARWAYRRASAIIAISSFTREEILKKMPDLEITVITPAVDHEEFSRAGGETETADIRPYILSVGRLRWRKGFHFSIRAFAKVAAAFPDMKYVIVGTRADDAYYRRLVNLIVELGLQGRVIIREDVPRDWYKNAELFCLFSQNMHHDIEGFGIVFLEAAAAGLPVVGSANCGVEDAVQEGENGLLVSTRSPDDFADAILTILRDPEMKKRMSQASLAFARASSWEKSISRYAEIYQGLTH